MLPTLLGMTIITFAVMAWSPGGLTAIISTRAGAVDPRYRQAIYDFYKKKYGLDKPQPVQYLLWLNGVSPVGIKASGAGWPSGWTVGFKTPDLGESIITHQPVLDMVEESLPITLLLNVITIPVIMALSVWSGVRAARKRGGLADVGGGLVMLGLWSVPQIWAGVMLVGYLGNREILHWFPSAGLHDVQADQFPFLPTLSFIGGWQFERGWLLDTAWHLVLPIICLSYAGFAFTSKLTRGAMLENIAADYIRTARAKGLPENVVLYRHVLRNGLLPLITSCASLLPSLIGGSIIVENIFALPGMGRLGVQAVFDKDPQMVMSLTLVASVLTLISFLLTDIAYAMADPRVSFEADQT
jgi:ABC-type dipeptide/oligopeptide/nickel transport system permease component